MKKMAIPLVILILAIPMAMAAEITVEPFALNLFLYGGETKNASLFVRWDGDFPITTYSGYNITQENGTWDGIGMNVSLPESVYLYQHIAEIVPMSITTDVALIPDNYTINVWFEAEHETPDCERDGLWGDGHEHRCLDDGTYEVCNKEGDGYGHINFCNAICEASPECSGFSPNTVFSSCTIYGESYLQDYCNYDCQISDDWCEDDFSGCTAAAECDDKEPNTDHCTYQCEYRPLFICVRDEQWGQGHEFVCEQDNTYSRCSVNGMDYEHVDECIYYCSASEECDGVAPGEMGCDDDCHYTGQLCGNDIIEIGEDCELPSTPDSGFCPQTQNECSGKLKGTRDGYGDCDDGCFCEEDDFVYGCIIGECGAECDDDGDCGPTECDHLDDCYGGTYRDYHDVDNECDGACECTENQCGDFDPVVTDDDGDGYDTECDGDCDDSDPDVYPGAEEICNGIDDNCDGTIDEINRPCGEGNCAGTETCSAGIWSDCSTKGNDCGICCICNSDGYDTYDEMQDSDCSPSICPSDGCGADDCGTHIFGDYPEYVDNECQGLFVCTQKDCDDYVTCEEDIDGDGYSESCGDCDDSDTDVYPGAEEICDGKDNDCDGTTDEGCECTPGETEPCGSGQCTGTMECIEPGYWGNCDTEGNDCGVCCECDESGNEDFDEEQDSDCPPTPCPDGCNIDSNPFTWDFAGDADNFCSGLFQCTQNQCDYGHECRDDDSLDGLDGDSCGAECDQNIDCTGYCSGSARHYGGYCDMSGCECQYATEDCDNYDCSTPNPLTCIQPEEDTLAETGDDYTCETDGCEKTGDLICGGPWLCNQDSECDYQLCGGEDYVCVFDSVYSWKGLYSEKGEICDDYHDNDCDGLMDCEDSDCLGLEGPNGTMCCATDSDCNDGNECTDDVCLDYQCQITINDSNTCSDGLYCTLSDHCSEGICTGMQKNCDDGNECTSEVCEENLMGDCVYNNLPDQTPCGTERDCLDDQCVLLNWTNYPDDGHDYCMSGTCETYSCDAVSSEYDVICEPPCYNWTLFHDGNPSEMLQFPQGGGSNSSAKIEMPTNINITTARVDLSGLSVIYSSDKKIDIVVVTDLSGSMDDNCGPDGIAQPGETPCKINDVKLANRELINITLDSSPNNTVGLVGYSTWVEESANLTVNKTELFGQTDGYDALYKTCISCGLQKAIEISDEGSNPTKVILLMTDGYPNRCTYGACTNIIARDEAIAFAEDAWETHGIMVYTVAFGEDSDQGTMQTIADVGNGEYYYTPSDNLTAFYTDIITKLIETHPENLTFDAGRNGIYEWNFTGEFNANDTANFAEELGRITHKCQSDPCPGCVHNSSSGNCTVDIELESEAAGRVLLSNLYIYGCECLGGTCPVYNPSGEVTPLNEETPQGSIFMPTPPEETSSPVPEINIEEPNYTGNTLTLKGCIEGGKGKIILYLENEIVQEAILDEEGCFEIEYVHELPEGMNKITLWNEDEKILETYVNAYSEMPEEENEGKIAEPYEIELKRDNGVTGMIFSGISSHVFIIVLMSLIILAAFVIHGKKTAKKSKMAFLIIVILSLNAVTFSAASVFAQGTECSNDGLWGNGHEFVCIDDSTYNECYQGTYIHVYECSEECGSDPECANGEPNTGFCTYQCDYKPLIVCFRDSLWGYNYFGPDHEYMCNPDNTYMRCSESGMDYDHINFCKYYCSASAECEGIAPGDNGCDLDCQFIEPEMCGDGIIQQPEECEYPSTSDNPLCSQSETECDGMKLGTRDPFGECNSGCFCIEDDFTYDCSVTECGAECDDQIECDDKCVGEVYHYDGNCESDCSCSYETEDCNDYDCNEETLICEIDTIEMIRETGEEYSCTSNGCEVTNNRDCGGPWICDETQLCEIVSCADEEYVCLYDSEYYWGDPTYPIESDCTDGLDNDCDGLTDCADDDCYGEEGPGGKMCCHVDNDCSDEVNECTDEICIDYMCESFIDDTNVCGFPQDCPEDHCIGDFWTIFPDDGHDFCSDGECITYSCEPMDSYADPVCEECDQTDYQIILQTDSSDYNTGEEVSITGEVTNPDCVPVQNRYVSILVTDFMGTPKFIAQLKTDSIGMFGMVFGIPGEWRNGSYVVRATYNTISNSTPFVITVPGVDHLLFSQVFYDTPGEDYDEEWVELYNPTNHPISLAGLKIYDNVSSWEIPGGTIGANDYYVIARNANGFANLYGCQPHVEGFTRSLNNDGDIVSLRDNGNEIDMVAWEGYMGWDLVADPNESLKRIPVSLDTDTPLDWIDHQVPSPHCIFPTGGLDPVENLQIGSDGDDSLLSWDSSGANAGYNIYTSETPDGFDYENPETTIEGNHWKDPSSQNYQQKYYVVRAFDSNGNEEENTNVVGKFDITLHSNGKGINYISLPLITDTQTSGELGQKIGTYVSIGKWVPVGQVGIEEGEFLLNPYEGYMVRVSEDTKFTIYGSVPDVLDKIKLRKEPGTYGIYWIALPVGTSLSKASELMASIGEKCLSVSRWDPIAQVPESWISFNGGFGKDFRIEPGSGYEIAISGDVDWYPE